MRDLPEGFWHTEYTRENAQVVEIVNIAEAHY